MKILLLSSLAVCLGGAAFAQVAPMGFESDTVEETASGWTGSGALVSDAQAHEGGHALALSSGATAGKAVAGWPEGQKVAWVDFWIKPVADVSEGAQTTVDLDGAKLAFVAGDGEGRVIAWDGKGQGQSVDTGVAFAIDEASQANAWLGVTIRQDFAAGTWDLFLDGKPVLGGLGLDNLPPRAKPGEWTFHGAPVGDTFLDDVMLSAQSLLFPDADNDGLPDAYEEAHGLDFTNPADRLSDRDHDGVSNFAEFVAGTSPSQEEEAGESSAHVIYVDNLRGSDAFSGRASYRSGGDGPKASLEGAISAARDGDILLVMPSPAAYRTRALSDSAKSLNLRPMGRVLLE